MLPDLPHGQNGLDHTAALEVVNSLVDPCERISLDEFVERQPPVSEETDHSRDKQLGVGIALDDAANANSPTDHDACFGRVEGPAGRRRNLRAGASRTQAIDGARHGRWYTRRIQRKICPASRQFDDLRHRIIGAA